ncbi:hypothetical protein [Paraburkholderia gardini]|uniref:hypothetical protein n=1 Tax=Paraburkholderia gardini TaxID=2823469 RepID=UPI001E19437F|nr:hypothetical protein [Paraburkholderia gardini]CAG4893520.1 hypothetical protein R69919_01668 [Paraburkholderia gardini]
MPGIGWSLAVLASVFFVGTAYADDTYEVVGSTLKVNSSRMCLLDKPPLYAVESFDKSAVMVSETGYVAKQELADCQAGRPVYVHSIPSNVGVLSDINLSKSIYVALDFVGARPFIYLATVARIGTSRNLVSVKGAYVAGRKLSDLRKSAFGGSGEAGTAIISPNGRYVAPSGQMDCSEYAYPGVWDVQDNRRIVATDTACAALFKYK